VIVRGKYLPVSFKMKKILIKSILLVFIAAAVLGPQPYFAASTASNAAPEEVVKVWTAWSVDRARPGDAIILAVVANIKKGYHINADIHQIEPFEDFKPYPTRLSVIDASAGITIEGPRYPSAVPLEVNYASGELMSFEGQSIIYLPIKLEETHAPGKLNLKLEFEYQACAVNYCLFPQKIKLKETLAVVASDANTTSVNHKLFAGYGAETAVAISRGVDFNLFGWTFSIDVSSGIGLVLLLLTAAFGGMLLNFTPCVLPLIPIKIISLSHAATNRKQCFLLGLSTFLGVLAFWIVLGALIALIADFTATNQLFQYPMFTIAVGTLIAIMATGMFGFFSVRLPNFVYMINPEQDTLPGAFGLGILAAILSTPCTAPFMGAAAAWAAAQTPVTTLATFAAIGMGMALPYLVLSASPKLVEKMPKTGPASVLIKEVMGLLMLAAGTYFIGIGLSAVLATPPKPSGKLYWWPVMFFSAAAGGWLAYKTLQIADNIKTKAFFAGIGILVIVVSAWGLVRLTDKGPIAWKYYTPENFEKALDEGKVVVLDFTAQWCLNCEALEQSVLMDPRIIDLFAKKEVVPMKVDITGNNPAGKAKLREAGTLTIPLLIVFSPNGTQVFKSDFYTVVQVYNAVTEALTNSK
jgi:thiol:disulfide interchange protein DsbD